MLQPTDEGAEEDQDTEGQEVVGELVEVAPLDQIDQKPQGRQTEQERGKHSYPEGERARPKTAFQQFDQICTENGRDRNKEGELRRCLAPQAQH